MSDSQETFDSVWAYCTAKGRVAPVPFVWNDLYRMLQGTRQKSSGGWEPPLPLILAAWDHSTPMEKQLRFREQIQWADKEGQLAEISKTIREIREDDWSHFGDL